VNSVLLVLLVPDAVDSSLVRDLGSWEHAREGFHHLLIAVFISHGNANPLLWTELLWLRCEALYKKKLKEYYFVTENRKL
jgi:hypothetical protein